MLDWIYKDSKRGYEVWQEAPQPVVSKRAKVFFGVVAASICAGALYGLAVLWPEHEAKVLQQQKETRERIWAEKETKPKTEAQLLKDRVLEVRRGELLERQRARQGASVKPDQAKDRGNPSSKNRPQP